jgi:sterol desaturase/sphingolipid hydroxylase (fatty acid hydroxylase superfamily)
MIPFIVIGAATVLFFILERVLPARELPETPGWYGRALFLNACQIGVVLLAGIAWNRWFAAKSLFHIADHFNPLAQGALGWFIGTFFFYWWHRARHDVNFLWRVCHQIHHSPARIEALTSFYKHPVEIAIDSMLSSALMFALLGASPAGGAWFNAFAVIGEYLYHSNLRTPRWFGYFIQRPEHHSIHHQLDVDGFNFGDITWWDRLFGTFREAQDFAPRCGFPEDHEKHLTKMLFFHDCY